MTGAERVLRPLPRTVTASRSPIGASARADRQRLADAQARAVAQRQHRGVAREDPRFARFALARGGGGDRARVGGAERPRQPPRRLGRAHRAERGGRLAPPSRTTWRASERRAESARCSERGSIPSARRRARKARRSAGREAGEFGDAGRRAEPLGEKGEKLARVAAIGLDRVGRKPPLAGEPAKPGRDDRRQIGRGGQGGGIRRLGHGGTLEPAELKYGLTNA